jgi:5-methylcytosine-specific restriction protein A
LSPIYETIDPRASEFLSLRETDKEQITLTRIGQTNFRKELIKIWGKCSVTGVENLELLSASHIKPWKNSNNSERLSPMNGLLLNPALDKAFDRGFISFDTEGKIIISSNLTREDAEKMAIKEKLKLRKFYQENQGFLRYHRQKLFKRN